MPELTVGSCRCRCAACGRFFGGVGAHQRLGLEVDQSGGQVKVRSSNLSGGPRFGERVTPKAKTSRSRHPTFHDRRAGVPRELRNRVIGS